MNYSKVGISSYAIAYTVKNEWRLLRHAIPYHLVNGCSHIYLFFDGTTDDAKIFARDFPQVTAMQTVPPSVIVNPPEWVRIISRDHANSVDFRKRINTLYAAELAATQGIEWICSIDADELLQPRPHFDNFSELLGSVAERIDQILLPNLELIPSPPYTDNPFSGQTLFINRKPLLQWLWRAINAVLGKFIRNPRRMTRLESLFFRTIFRGVYPPVMINPLDGSNIYRGYFLAYNNHKSFMRTKRAREFNFNIHYWAPINRSARTIQLGRVLHYDLPDFDYFLLKFQQRPKTMTSQVFLARYEISRVAVEADPVSAREFFEKYVAVSEPGMAERLIARGIATRIEDVAKSFS